MYGNGLYANLASMSVILVYIIPVVLYMYQGNSREIYALMGACTTTLIGEGIKYGIIGYNNVRPQGAYDCNSWCSDGKQGGQPGMPSGHAASVSFFTAYYFDKTDNAWIQLVLIMFAVVVISSRYIKQCHTIEQLIAGSLLGIGMGVFTDAMR